MNIKKNIYQNINKFFIQKFILIKLPSVGLEPTTLHLSIHSKRML